LIHTGLAPVLVFGEAANVSVRSGTLGQCDRQKPSQASLVFSLGDSKFALSRSRIRRIRDKSKTHRNIVASFEFELAKVSYALVGHRQITKT